MNKQLRNKIFNQQIITFAIIGLMLFTLSGCQQVNNLANSNASTDQANSSTNSNPNADKTLKNNLIGTWIGTSTDNKTKIVFTEDEVTEYEDGKLLGTTKYKLVDEQTVEYTNPATGETSQVKATIEGDELTIIEESKTGKFKRESSTAEANNSTTEESEKIKEMRKNIIGTWSISRWERQKVVEGGKITYPYGWKKVEAHSHIFGKDEYQEFLKGQGSFIVIWRGPYHIVDEETVKWTSSGYHLTAHKISFEDKNTMIWEEGSTKLKFNRVSDKSDFKYEPDAHPHNSFYNKLAGVWISDNKTLTSNAFGGSAAGGIIKKYYSDGTSKSFYGETRSFSGDWQLNSTEDKFYEITDTQEKVTTDGEVLTITDKNGAVEKYTRKKTID